MNNGIKFAWLAGLFEGEGSFSINYKTSRAVVMTITSTDMDVIEKIKKWFGGKIYNGYVRKDKPHYKKSYIWTCSGQPAVSICERILATIYILGQAKLCKFVIRLSTFYDDRIFYK